MLNDKIYEMINNMKPKFKYFISIEDYVEHINEVLNVSTEFKIEYFKNVFIFLTIFYLFAFITFLIDKSYYYGKTKCINTWKYYLAYILQALQNIKIEDNR